MISLFIAAGRHECFLTLKAVANVISFAFGTPIALRKETDQNNGDFALWPKVVRIIIRLIELRA